jgi:hypothetical protein
MEEVEKTVWYVEYLLPLPWIEKDRMPLHWHLDRQDQMAK